MTISDSGDVFVEQAEFLDASDFDAWAEQHPNERQILQKLCRGGGKLITGPRGCGKTTLLLKAYRNLSKPESKSLPIYVNFKSSLRLEPLYKQNANATYWFHQWMVLKCYSGLVNSLTEMNLDGLNELPFVHKEIKVLTEKLELGSETSDLDKIKVLSLESLSSLIETILSINGKARCVVLFDDAAHAFSSEQQRDFFDLFRRLKSKQLAPKAAIYPGITVSSPSFHIGHDAEEVAVWIDPYSAEYLPFMRSLLSKRLPASVYKELAAKSELLDLVCFGAFGMPRALLNIVRSFYEENSNEYLEFKTNFTSQNALTAIRRSYENTVRLYSSLRYKLPMYANFLATGEELLEEMIRAIKSYNSAKSPDRQSVSIAMGSEPSNELERVIGFLEYSGLLMFHKPVSRGVKGRFQVYYVHSGGLIDRNALLGRKSVSADSFSSSLKKRHAHEFTRVTPSKLLKVESLAERLTLDLPPCENCGAPRASESAKFCLECGSPLTAISTFRLLAKTDISELPISARRVDRIKQHSKIRTVGDILLDHDKKKLRGVPRIGPYWARRIFSYAEEFLA